MTFGNSILKSISGSLVFKLSTAAISLITVPLLINALGVDDYGVWVTLTSIITWVMLFDFGAGFSLKNKVTEYTVTKVNLNGVISGAIQFYVLCSIILLIAFIVSIFLVPVFVDHTKLALLIYLPVIFVFPFTLGNFILQGLKKFNLVYALQLVNAVLWLGFVSFFKLDIFKINLTILSIVFSSLFVFTNSLVIIFALRNVGFNLRQVFNLSHLINSDGVFKSGFKFFFLQISSLVIFSLGNVLIYENLTEKDVSVYDTVNKIFAMGITIFTIVISIYWGEISHAKALLDKTKLLRLYKQLIILSIVFSIGALVVWILIPELVAIWTGGVIQVNVKLVSPFVLLIIVQIFSCAGNVFLNAFEDLNGQIVFSIVTSILFIPCVNLFFANNYGITAVPFSSAILSIPTMIFVLIKGYSCIKSVNKNVVN